MFLVPNFYYCVLWVKMANSKCEGVWNLLGLGLGKSVWGLWGVSSGCKLGIWQKLFFIL